MKLILIVLAFIGLVGLGYAEANADSPTNLLERRNPSFEKGFKRWSFRAEAYQPIYRIVKDAPGECGEKSLRLKTSGPGEGSWGTQSELQSGKVTIPTTGKYIVSVWIKRTPINDFEYSDVSVLLREEHTNYGIGGFGYMGPKAKNKWDVAQNTIVLNEGAVVWLAIQSNNWGGKVFIDCASIVKK